MAPLFGNSKISQTTKREWNNSLITQGRLRFFNFTINSHSIRKFDNLNIYKRRIDLAFPPFPNLEKFDFKYEGQYANFVGIFFKSYPIRILVLVFVVMLVVSGWLQSPKNGRKSNLKMKGGSEIAWGKERISLIPGFSLPNSVFSPCDFATPRYTPFQEVTFEKNFLRNSFDALTGHTRVFRHQVLVSVLVVRQKANY